MAKERETIMPVPGGEITGSEIWRTPAPELVDAEECPCFHGATCPTNGKHLEPCECDDGCEGCKDK